MCCVHCFKFGGKACNTLKAGGDSALAQRGVKEYSAAKGEIRKRSLPLRYVHAETMVLPETAAGVEVGIVKAFAHHHSHHGSSWLIACADHKTVLPHVRKCPLSVYRVRFVQKKNCFIVSILRVCKSACVATIDQASPQLADLQALDGGGGLGTMRNRREAMWLEHNGWGAWL